MADLTRAMLQRSTPEPSARRPLLAMLAPCVAALLLAACPDAAPPRAGPPSLDLDGPATYRAFRERQLRQVKMRHQVESRFGPRTEVIEGFMILLRPDRFWVRAQSPLGGTLFDVKRTMPGELSIDLRIPELEGSPAPMYLARDIQRIYLAECPPGSPVQPVARGFAVSCSLAVLDAPIHVAGRADGPDDAMELSVSPAGVLLEKRFFRDGEETARVDFDDYRLVGGSWLAHRITLAHQQVSYGLTVVLLSADPGFDAARVLGGSS